MFIAKNLQYLRRRDKITQEELAEKLNVSRQSVSKWEIGEAYPETEKLLALCELFDVSLDGLMRSDLSKTESDEAEFAPSQEEANDEPIREAASDGANVEPTEFSVYAKHIDGFSRAIAIGVALILFGVAVCVCLCAYSITLPEVTANVVKIMSAVSVILFVAAAVFLFIMFGQKHENFKINNRLIAEPTEKVHKGFAPIMAGLVSAILLDVVFLIVLNSLIDADIIPTASKDAAMCYVTAAFLGALAFIVGGLVYMGIQHGKYDLSEYRKQVGRAGGGKFDKLADTICGVIMLTATAIYLLLGFLGGLWHPGWIVFPVGGIICGIVSTIFNAKKG